MVFIEESEGTEEAFDSMAFDEIAAVAIDMLIFVGLFFDLMMPALIFIFNCWTERALNAFALLCILRRQ